MQNWEMTIGAQVREGKRILELDNNDDAADSRLRSDDLFEYTAVIWWDMVVADIYSKLALMEQIYD